LCKTELEGFSVLLCVLAPSWSIGSGNTKRHGAKTGRNVKQAKFSLVALGENLEGLARLGSVRPSRSYEKTMPK
jgi:hypothetical protein